MNVRASFLLLTAGAMVVAALPAATVSHPPVFAQAVDRAPKSPMRHQAHARVIGVVFDSVRMRPLGDALVQLVALNDSNRIRSVRADSAGGYAIDSVPMGVYMLGFLHDRLDSLQLESSLHRIEVQLAGDVRVPLAIPSAGTVITRRCGPTPRGRLPTMFMGTVRSAQTSEPASGARVRAQWNEILVGPRGLEKRSPAHYVTTAASGAFVFCGVPTDVAIVTRAFATTDSSGVIELQSPENGLLMRDLRIGSVADKRARVRGAVRAAGGEPINGARLQIWGTSGSAITAGAGQFEVSGLPSGTYLLESRALGYQPARQPLDLTAADPATVTIAMVPIPVVTDTVRVRGRATSVAVPLADFERRRKSGDGHFFDEQQLKAREVMYMADIFRSTVGMTVMQGIYGGDRVLMRASGGGGPCVPAVFLNGLSLHTTDGVLDALVNPQEVRAVEIYMHVASVPIQFQSMNGCGSIVLWTGARSTRSSGR